MFRYALLTLVVGIAVILFAQWIGGAINGAFDQASARIESAGR